MKTKFFAAAIAALGFTANSYGQADTATANANIHIVTPISISKETDLDFGNVSPGISGGSVSVPAASGIPTRSTTGDVLLPVITGTVGAASFDVSGEPNYTYSITLPGNSDVVMNDGGSNNIAVTDFVCDLGSSGTLSALGAQTFYVGAKATIAQGQASGDYTATFDVSVVYL